MVTQTSWRREKIARTRVNGSRRVMAQRLGGRMLQVEFWGGGRAEMCRRARRTKRRIPEVRERM